MSEYVSSLEALAQEDDTLADHGSGAIDSATAVRQLFTLIVNVAPETELKEHLQQRSLIFCSEAGIRPDQYGEIWEEVIKAKRENSDG